MKYALVIAMVLIAGLSHAETWHTANQHTFEWDAGDGVTTSYKTFLKPWKGGAMIPGPEVTTTSVVLTMPSEGRFFPCVQAVRVIADEPDPFYSDIVCADVAINCQGGEAFGFRYFVPPGNPKNLR
jgi:hypothetical protein